MGQLAIMIQRGVAIYCGISKHNTDLGIDRVAVSSSCAACVVHDARLR
jgi:hypothetical protein